MVERARSLEAAAGEKAARRLEAWQNRQEIQLKRSEACQSLAGALE